MRIIINEIKKIFNLKMIFLLIIINFIMFFLVIEFEVKYFPNGRPEGDIYNIAVQMKKDYGTEMDEREFQHFIKIYNERLKTLDDCIEKNEEFKKLAIKNYKEYTKVDDKISSENNNYSKDFKEAFSKIKEKVIFQEPVDLFWEVSERERIIEKYKYRNKALLNGPFNYNKTGKYTKEQLNRIHEILNKSYTSIFPEFVYDNYIRFIIRVAMTIIISVIFIISPMYIRDNKNKVNNLQYISKRGRKIFKSKLLSGYLCSFIVTTIQLLVFFKMYEHNNTKMFFNCNVNSFLNFSLFWSDITFFQYIIITVLAIYIMVFIFTTLSMIVSNKVNTYIALIGIQLPIVVLVFKFILYIAILNLINIRFPKIQLPICYILVMLLSILGIWAVWKREKTMDII